MRILRCLLMTAMSAAVPVSALVSGSVARSAQLQGPTAQQKVPVTAPPAQPPTAAPAPVTPAQPHPLTQPDLEAFFDGIFPLQLERSDIAGSSVLVMKDGQVLFEKGYGFSDMKTRTPVDAKNTIFRLASISKLFTWVSIMQLQEQGKVDIDTDVNRYLDFQIKPAFNQPVTLRNLMTHTAGFEEVEDDIIVLDPKKEPTLREDMIQNQPKRLFPPGVVPAYSNYGVGLASYIVQRVSGERFEQYVRDHIFTPLGMKHSSFYQPIQKELAPLVSQGYRGDTTTPPVGFEMLNPVGAGGLSSTADDMGRFSQALLNGGELDGQRILKPETVAAMWTPQFRASPQLPPICMGFYENWRNHLHWIGHEGDLIAFHSLFFMEPAQKIVLFVSYNSAGGGGKPRPELIDAFSDRYFPGAPAVTFVAKPSGDFRDIGGTYQTTRRADSTKQRFMNIGDQVSATVDKDGVLTISGFKDLRGHPQRYKLIGKDLWQTEDDQGRVFAIRGGHNRVVRIASMFPGQQLERVPWYANEGWIVPAMMVSYGILALVFLAGLMRLGWRLFFRKRPRWEPQPGTLRLTFAPRAAAFLWVVFVGGVAVFLMVKGDDLLPPTPAWFPWFVAMNWVTGLCLLVSFFAILAAIRIWFREVRWITKVKFTLVGLACLFLSWCSIFYHVIGPAHRI